MKLLVLADKRILATGEPVETAGELRYPDLVVPKHVVPGYQLVEAGDLPADYAPEKYLWDGGFTLNPDYTAPQES